MPLSRRIARANRAGLNRLTRHIAPWLPGFGVIIHRGRRSGRIYRTPVNVFRAPRGHVVALTYGRESDWVRNVLAAGEAELRTRGRRIEVRAPHIVHDEGRRLVAPVVRPTLRRLHVADFLVLGDGAGAEGQPG